MVIRGGVYKIINLVNGKLYIGSTNDLKKRESEHFNALRNGTHNRILQNSFNKYGESNFKFEVLEYVENKEDLELREQFYFDTLKPKLIVRKIAKNNSGIKWSDEQKNKMSKAQKDNFLKNGYGNKFGYKLSDEQKENMSNAQKKRFLTEVSSNKGKKISEEQKEKIRQANLGKKVLDEVKMKISSSLKGKPKSQEARNRMSENKKKYYQNKRLELAIDKI